MKWMMTAIAILVCTLQVNAQKVKLKNGLLTVDDKEVAYVKGEKSEGTLGLVKDYTVTNMDGDMLFTAVYSDRFPEDPADNTIYHFEFHFPAQEVTAYFPVGKLGTDKSIGKLIGKHGLIQRGEIDADALQALIEKKGQEPPVLVDYSVVNRNKSWPLDFREKGVVEQNGKVIGNYVDHGTLGDGRDHYSFVLPSGVVIAEVKFSGSNNAAAFDVYTYKDDRQHTARFEVKDKASFVAAIERNYYAIKRITPWLVENGYL